jgi:transposase
MESMASTRKTMWSSGATSLLSSRSCRRVLSALRPALRRIIGRELQALGHSVRLMPPAYVKPHVKRHKNDAADAEAICEAVTRTNMRFVETKTPEQQSCLMLHRTRHLFIRQQTAVINAIRAHFAEFGIVAAGRTQWGRALRRQLSARSGAAEEARHCNKALAPNKQPSQPQRSLRGRVLELQRFRDGAVGNHALMHI